MGQVPGEPYDDCLPEPLRDLCRVCLVFSTVLINTVLGGDFVAEWMKASLELGCMTDSATGRFIALSLLSFSFLFHHSANRSRPVLRSSRVLLLMDAQLCGMRENANNGPEKPVYCSDAKRPRRPLSGLPSSH